MGFRFGRVIRLGTSAALGAAAGWWFGTPALLTDPAGARHHMIGEHSAQADSDCVDVQLAVRSVADEACKEAVRREGGAPTVEFPEAEADREFGPAHVRAQIIQELGTGQLGDQAWLDCDEFPCLVLVESMRRQESESGLPLATTSVFFRPDAEGNQVTWTFAVAAPRDWMLRYPEIASDASNRLLMRQRALRASAWGGEPGLVVDE